MAEFCAIEARDLVVAYGDRVALSVAHLTIPVGATVALVGPNGSGKSTLLRAIAGLTAPRAGALLVFGRPATSMKGQIAYVLQATAIDETLPIVARDVVMMARYRSLGLFGRLSAADRQIVADAMARLGITELASRRLTELSGGQRQRVLVAQGLAQQADLLLLDEPVTGLDLVSRERILGVVAEERAAGRTVVMATHDLNDAARCDLVVVLAGRALAVGPPNVALQPSVLAEAYGVIVTGIAGSEARQDLRHDFRMPPSAQ